jgi:hypothetical protein
MPFEKFTEFLNKKSLKEELNPVAHRINIQRQQFNNWMNANNLNYEDATNILNLAGYLSVPDFIANPNHFKYTNLRIPGQENYS